MGVKSRKFSACGGVFPPIWGGKTPFFPPWPPKYGGAKNRFAPPDLRNMGGQKTSKCLFPPHMAEKKHPPRKIAQSRIENRSWIFPRFHHRDPKIRKNHKIKTSVFSMLSSKWMKKVQKNLKSENFVNFTHFRVLCLP